jgi:hypothetical protein
LRRNLMKVVCKSTLDASLDIAARWRYTRTAMAMHRIAPSEFEECIRQVLD